MTDAEYLARFADGNEAHTYFVPAVEPIAVKLRVVYVFSRTHDITLVTPPAAGGNWIIKSDEYTLIIVPNTELESVQLAEHQALYKILCKPVALEQVTLAQFRAVEEASWDYETTVQHALATRYRVLHAFLEEYAVWIDRGVTLFTDRRTAPCVSRALVWVRDKEGREASLAIELDRPQVAANEQQAQYIYRVVCQGLDNSLAQARTLDDFAHRDPRHYFFVSHEETEAVKADALRTFVERYRDYYIKLYGPHNAGSAIPRPYLLLKTNQPVPDENSNKPLSLCLVITRTSPSENEAEFDYLSRLFRLIRTNKAPSF